MFTKNQLIKKQYFMKKLPLILAAACLLIGCSNEKTFKISGTLTDYGNPDDPTMLYLKTRDANEQLINIDSTYLTKNESFILKGKSSETDLYFLTDKDNVFFMRIFIDPGNKIKVTGSAVNIPEIKIEGSETQEFYEEYQKSLDPMFDEQENIRQTYSLYVGYLENNSISEEEFQQIEDDLIISFNQLEEAVNNVTLEFITSHSNHLVAAYLVYRNTQSLNNSTEIEEQLQLLDTEMKNKYVTHIKNLIERIKQTEHGAVLPNIELPDANGNLISLESLRGKYVLVDFWATWCMPCVREIPNLKKAYEKYHNKGFEIYSISLDIDKEAWLNGLIKYELNWINVCDLESSPTARQMAIKYIPHTFLLDKSGVIIAVNLREEALESKLAELMP